MISSTETHTYTYKRAYLQFLHRILQRYLSTHVFSLQYIILFSWRWQFHFLLLIWLMALLVSCLPIHLWFCYQLGWSLWLFFHHCLKWSNRSNDTIIIDHSIPHPYVFVLTSFLNFIFCSWHHPIKKILSKKRFSIGSTLFENKNTEDSTSLLQSPPESDFSSSWLWIDLPMPIPSTLFYTHSDILLSF